VSQWNTPIQLIYANNNVKNNMPLSGYNTVCLSLHILKDIFALKLWQLQIKLLWTFVYRFLCGHMFPFISGMYIGVELLGSTVILGLIFWGITELFSTVVKLFCLSYSSRRALQFLHLLIKFVHAVFSILVIPVCLK
jgi:hypothetical protein